MRSYFIPLDSYTEAKRAAKYLSSFRKRAVVEKNGSPRGCTFGIRVWESPERICRLLADIGIRCRDSNPPPPFPPFPPFPPPPPRGAGNNGFMR